MLGILVPGSDSCNTKDRNWLTSRAGELLQIADVTLERTKVTKAIGSTLQKTAMKIITTVNRDKEHIPPLTQSETNLFPFHIEVLWGFRTRCLFTNVSSVEPESRRLGEEYRNILIECGIGRPKLVYVTWLSIACCINIDRRHMIDNDQWQCYSSWINGSWGGFCRQEGARVVPHSLSVTDK